MYMAVHISDPEAEGFIRRLAELRGTTLTDAVREACRQAVSAIEDERERRQREARLILAEIDSWPKTGLTVDKAFFDSLNDE
jgi:antitoxin VapB